MKLWKKIRIPAAALALLVFGTASFGTVLHVSNRGSDANSGLSWESAKATILGALSAAAAGDEIWVAAGVYEQCIILKPGVAVYGGFAGKEVLRAERNWALNQTVIDGGGRGPVVYVPNGAGSDTILDGFTVRHGVYPIGAGIYCDSDSPTIANCRITDNRARLFGGGIFCGGSGARIVNCLILHNQANYGAGIYCTGAPGPILVNNTIAQNTVFDAAKPQNGLGLYVGFCDPVIANNIVAFNGSGIFAAPGTSMPMLYNNCVSENSNYNYSGLAAGPGDIAANPLFASIPASDYHLQPASPCVDAADTIMAPSTDADGSIRPQDGRLTGSPAADIGAYELPFNLAVAKKSYPDGLPVVFGGLPVTAWFPLEQRIYVETPDRCTGIGVRSSTPYAVGRMVNVIGTMATDPINGERYVAAADPWPMLAGGEMFLQPLSMSNRTLGGGPNGLQKGIRGMAGVNNIGLLVQTWGLVTESAVGGSWFRVDDGSVDSNGSPVRPKIATPLGVAPPPVGSYVSVTGISSCEKESMYSDDFAGYPDFTTPAGWVTLRGTMRVLSRRFQKVSPAAEALVRYGGGDFWRDYAFTVSAGVTVPPSDINTPALKIGGRVDAAGHGYYVRYYPAQGLVDLVADYGPWAIWLGVGLAIDARTFTIAFEGSMIRVFINGSVTPSIEVNDTGFAQGSIALGSSAEAVVWFADAFVVGPIYQENFDTYPDDVIPAGWNITQGNMKAQSGQFVSLDSGSPAMAIYGGGLAWRDYVFTSEAAVTSWTGNPFAPAYAVCGRVQPDGRGYYVRYYPQDGLADLIRVDGGTAHWLGVGVVFTPQTLTLEFEGSNIRVFSDGGTTPVIQATDSTYPSGTIAFWTNPGFSGWFDKISVSSSELMRLLKVRSQQDIVRIP